MAKLWLKNGRLVIKNGRLMLCDHCPCDSECMKAVKARVRQLVEVAETHEVVMSAGGGYNCPTYVYNEETGDWECEAMASGSLVLVLSRAQSMPDYFSWEADGEIMVYATTLRNKATQAFLTIGCYCSFNYETYECDNTYTELSGYCIAGTVDAYKVEDISQYDPWYSCKGDECQIKTKKIEAYASWYGGTLCQEGFIIVSDGQGGETYQDVLRAWRYVRDNVEYYQVLDCYCDFLFPWEEQEWTSNHEYVAVPGYCKLPCKWTKILEIKAQRSFWSMHYEGAVFRTYSNSSVFNYEPYGRYLAGAVALDGIWVVGCGCSGLSKIPFTEQAPASSWTYLDMPDACTCLDTRELLTTYPDEFGVTEINFGSNTILGITDEYDNTHYEHPANYRNVTAGYALDAFLDFRTFVFVIAIAEHRMRWGYISPTGSPTGSSTPSTEYYSIAIMGNWEPFTHHPYMYSPYADYPWTGIVIEWNRSKCGHQFYCYDDEDSAKARSESEEKDYVCGLNSYDIDWFKNEVTEPITSISEVEKGEYHYETEGPNAGKWCGAPKSIHYADTPYRRQWIQTNLGLITYSNRTPQKSILVYGMNPYAQSMEWITCCHWSCAYGEDTTINATLIDTGMHYCHDDYVIPTEESDSPSSSLEE